MNILSKVILLSAMLGSSIASASTDANAETVKAFWNSTQVLERVENIKALGFKFTPEPPVVTMKHYFSASFGVLERAYLVSQVFRRTQQAWGQATNISAVVTLDAYKNVVSVKVIDFVKSGSNDVNGGLDEN